MKKKLLYILHGLNIGGTEVIVRELSNHFQRKFEIGILVLDYQGKLWQDLEGNKDIKLYFLDRKPGWSLSNFKKFFKLIKTFKPDIIHAHQYSPFFFAAISKLFFQTSARLIFTEHGRHYPDYVSLKRKLVNQILQLSLDEVTAVCKFSTKALKEKEGINKKIEVIYNGIEVLTDTNKNYLLDFNLPKEAIKLAYIGSFRPVKNPLLLLEAFKLLTEENKNVFLFLTGAGILQSDIVNFIKQHNLSDRIFLTGEVWPAADILKDMDIFVQPSLSEANSLALLEAMALGVVPVVTDVGGAGEVVRHSRNGLLTESNNPLALKENLKTLIEDPELRQKLSLAAKASYQEAFTLDKMIAGYEKITNREF